MNDSEFKRAHQAYEDRLLSDYLDRNGVGVPTRFKDAKSEYEFWIEAGEHTRAQELLGEELKRFYDFYHYETFGEEVQGSSPLVDKTIDYLKENTFRNQDGKNELFQKNIDFVLNEKTMVFLEKLLNNKGYASGFQVNSNLLKPMIAEVFLHDVIKFAQEVIKDPQYESEMRIEFPILQKIDYLDLPDRGMLFGYGKTNDPLYDKLFQAFYQNLQNDDMQEVLSLAHDLYDKVKHDLDQVEFYTKVSAKGKEDVYAKLTAQDLERLKRGESLKVNGQTIEGPNWSPRDWELNGAKFQVIPDTIKNQALKNEKFGDHEFSYPIQEVALQENVSLNNFRKMK